MRNEEVLLRVNERRNILHEIRKRKANWIRHILRRNCLLQQVIEGKIKGIKLPPTSLHIRGVHHGATEPSLSNVYWTVQHCNS